MASNDNPEADESCKCGFCGKIFGFLSDLEMHKQKTNHYGTSDMSYICEHCNYAVNHGSDFYRHQKTHYLVKPFQCNYCSKGFLYKQRLQNHIRTHTGERPFQCNYCSKGFLYKQQLQNHIRTHTGEPPFQCEVCGKSFQYKSNMYRHVRRIHNKEQTKKIE